MPVPAVIRYSLLGPFGDGLSNGADGAEQPGRFTLGGRVGSRALRGRLPGATHRSGSGHQLIRPGCLAREPKHYD